MTPQEAANRAAAVLNKAENWAEPGSIDTTGSAMALATVADSWTRLAEALAQNQSMIEKPATP